MSASYLVDERATVSKKYSLPSQSQLSPSGMLCGLSGVQVGALCDMLYTDSFCNMAVTGEAVFASGPLIIQAQCSDDGINWNDPTSGWYSGIANQSVSFTYLSSGGNLIIASGTNGWLWQSGAGDNIMSGFSTAGGFQRPQRYVRALFNSGYYLGNLVVIFNSQIMVTGSGGGNWGTSGGYVVNV